MTRVKLEVKELSTETKKTFKIPHCPECDSTETYFRSKTRVHRCKRCGHTW